MAFTLYEYYGDLLTADVDIIAHQCNVMSKNHRGLADTIFKVWPGVNTYYKNPRPDMYGSIDLYLVDHTILNRTVGIANMYCQVYPGRGISRPNDSRDTPDGRLSAFESSFGELNRERINLGLKSIGFPHLFGCGLAGGNWKTYHDMIIILGEQFGEKDDLEVHIVGLKKDAA